VRTPIRWWFLAACLLAPGLAGSLPAAENTPPVPDTAALDRRVRDVLKDVINEGADLYNDDHASLCCFLWQGALRTLPPLLDHRPELKRSVQVGLANAVREPYADRRAFALRAVLDKVYNTVNVGPEEQTATAPAARTAPPARGAEAPRADEKVPAQKSAKPEPATLWDRLGGTDGVAKIADSFVKKMVKDPRVNFTRGGQYKIDDAKQEDIKRKLVELASVWAGGPLKEYSGKPMNEAHPKGMGITDEEFNAAKDDMREALEENGVQSADMRLILFAVESTRSKIVTAGPNPAARTLWERLGGQTNVAKIADDFVDLAIEDPRVDFTRGGQYLKTDDDRKALKRKLVELASVLAGGPLKEYSGKNMSAAHPPTMGITDEQFTACLKDLQKALEKNGVKEKDAKAVMVAAEATRKNIVAGKMPGLPAPAPAPESRAPRQDPRPPTASVPPAAAPTAEPVVHRPAAAAPAGLVDDLLPDDTESVVRIDVRQILNSPLGRKLPTEKIEGVLRSQDEIDRNLKEAGFDPLKDLDSIVMAGFTGSEADKGLFIVHGRFDVQRIRARVDEIARDMPGVFKIHTVPDGLGGTARLCEVTPPGQDNPLWVALPNGSTLLASGGKDYVLDALEKEAGRKQTALMNKDLVALLRRLDTTQSFWAAVLGSTLAKNPQLSRNPDVKEVVDKISDVTATINIDKDLKAQVSVTARTADDARDLDEKFKDGLNTALGALALLAGQKKELAPLVDVLKNVKPDVKGKVVSVELQIAGKDIERAIDKNKD
jgi:truncated hemoglobin YjbI